MKTFKTPKWDNTVEDNFFKELLIDKKKNTSKIEHGNKKKFKTNKIKKTLSRQKSARDKEHLIQNFDKSNNTKKKNKRNKIKQETKIMFEKKLNNNDVQATITNDPQRQKKLKLMLEMLKQKVITEKESSRTNETNKKAKKKEKPLQPNGQLVNQNQTLKVKKQEKLREKLLHTMEQNKKIKPSQLNKQLVNHNQTLKMKKQEKLREKLLQTIEQDKKINPPQLNKQLVNQNQSLKMKKQENLRENILQTIKENKKTKPAFTLRQRMMDKLKAARFRFLNEQIYTTNSREAQKIFKKDPEAFTTYHEGYRQQVESWPINPVDVIIRSIKKMSKFHVIADFGCGDAKIAKSVEQKVHSFDLVAADESIIACDMTKVPLENHSVDVVIFCLSLMGTNLNDYILEANRVLKVGGMLKIAEVESRFEDLEAFVKKLQQFGFRNVWKDLSHNLFYFLDFTKVNDVKSKKKMPVLSLSPCLYKKR